MTLRVLMLLSLALLPLGAIGIWQTQRIAAQSAIQLEASLLSLTQRAANPLQDVLQHGFGAAQALSQRVAELRDDPAACSAYLGAFVERVDGFSYAAFLGTDGIMECSADGRRFDFSEFPNFERSMVDPQPSVSVNADAPLSRRAVVLINQPIRSTNGAFAGILTLSVPRALLDAPEIEGARAPFSLVTFNVFGDVLTSSSDEAMQDHLPADVDLRTLPGAGSRAFSAPDMGGEERVFAVVPIVADTAYALTSWPRAAVEGGAIDRFVVTSALPILMWVASLLVAVMALERLILRHIRALGRQMRAFARSRRLTSRPTMDDAGMELETIETEFREMARAIVQDEALLEDNLREKNILLKEIHHRVKNNLQLISSIMNMQARRLESKEALDVLRRVQDRVMGLAAVHRSLYQTPDLNQIDAGAMISDLARQIAVTGTGGAGSDFDVSADPVHLTTDRAVALSLTVSEAMTNAVEETRRAADAGLDGRIVLSLTRPDAQTARLTVENPCVDPDPAGDRKAVGLGQQLVRAFARQLDGALSTRREGGRYVMDLTFPIRADQDEPRDY
ncbi:sensor histidine kinase [Jannaschia sp. LMIT008]|uniref:sensor histidine kinase n=1 Tax=Jannaschia maritima TaxID=3032585 RepID=UPI00281178AF|nr:sensor histidine kinase [Jannaschia sp. LMIT008]